MSYELQRQPERPAAGDNSHDLFVATACASQPPGEQTDDITITHDCASHRDRVLSTRRKGTPDDCVNRSADFYPYTGEPCKSGYQLGSGNCRKTDGRMVAVSKAQCAALAGTVELPFEGGRRPQTPKP